MSSQLLVRNTQSPGDIVVLSAAIRDLYLSHPNKFSVSMCVSAGSEHVYHHNPYIVKAYPAPGKGLKGQAFVAHYPLIKQSNQQRKHFLWGFIEYFNQKLHTNIKLTDFRPDLHVSESEKASPLIQPPYWVFLSGGKTDFQAKIWARKYWQQLISMTRKDIAWVQCGGGSKNHIMHEQIDGIAHYMVKKTSLRDFIRLIYHADGVVCAITAAMHIAAGFNKPCVVIAGGREPWWWEAYTNQNRVNNMRIADPRWQIPKGDTYVEHAFLHTIDKLQCCTGHGCWKSKISGKTGSNCKQVVDVAGQRIPKCLSMITPEMVAESVFSYYTNGAMAHKPITTGYQPKHIVYGLRGKSVQWLQRIKGLLSGHIDIYDPSADRLTAIRELIAKKSDWLVWFEEGAYPAHDHWLRIAQLDMAGESVKGRIYRTEDDRFYLHPGFFIAATAALNVEATTYIELFSKVDRAKMLPVGEEIHLPIIRPCGI